MGKLMNIKDKYIGEGQPCYIIAEMSANHAGEMDRALEIIHAAKEAGADCIKIQTYTPDTMTIDSDKDWFKIKEGTWKGENLYKLYQKAHTPWEWQGKLKQEADRIGIDFLSTPFDKTSVDFLEGLGVDFYKIASFELTDIPLIKYIASKGKPIIISTGMGSFDEIEEAVKTIRGEKNNNICLLKCSSAYPAITDEMNLRTIRHMEKAFDVVSGLSDHSLGSLGAVAAVAMGAKVIEKHFCISRQIENPDASFSMEPLEFKQMVDDIRSVEKAIGTVSYEVSKSEAGNRIFRRSIFVAEDIKPGELFTEKNIRIVRPSYGIEPRYYDDIIGKKASKGIEKGTPLDWNMIE